MAASTLDQPWLAAYDVCPLNFDPPTPFILPPAASQALTVAISIPADALLGSHDTTAVTLNGEGQRETVVTSLLSTYSSCAPVLGLVIALSPNTVRAGDLITLTGTVATWNYSSCAATMRKGIPFVRSATSWAPTDTIISGDAPSGVASCLLSLFFFPFQASRWRIRLHQLAVAWPTLPFRPLAARPGSTCCA